MFVKSSKETEDVEVYLSDLKKAFFLLTGVGTMALMSFIGVFNAAGAAPSGNNVSAFSTTGPGGGQW